MLLCNLEACSKVAITGTWYIPVVCKNGCDLKGKVVAIGDGTISQKIFILEFTLFSIFNNLYSRSP